jgi:hypothetical protein
MCANVATFPDHPNPVKTTSLAIAIPIKTNAGHHRTPKIINQ